MVDARYFSFSFFRKKKVLTQADIFSRPFLNNVFFFYILNCKYKKKVCHLPINSRQKVKRLTLCPPQMLYRIVCDKVGSSLIIRVWQMRHGTPSGSAHANRSRIEWWLFKDFRNTFPPPLLLLGNLFFTSDNIFHDVAISDPAWLTSFPHYRFPPSLSSNFPITIDLRPWLTKKFC